MLHSQRHATSNSTSRKSLQGKVHGRGFKRLRQPGRAHTPHPSPLAAEAAPQSCMHFDFWHLTTRVVLCVWDKSASCYAFCIYTGLLFFTRETVTPVDGWLREAVAFHTCTRSLKYLIGKGSPMAGLRLYRHPRSLPAHTYTVIAGLQCLGPCNPPAGIWRVQAGCYYGRCKGLDGDTALRCARSLCQPTLGCPCL